MINEEKWKKFSKEELIQFCLLRNDDAKDYSKVLTSNLKNINKIVKMALDVQKEKKDLFIEKFKKRLLEIANSNFRFTHIEARLLHENIDKLNKEVFDDEK